MRYPSLLRKYEKCLALYGRRLDEVEAEKLSLWAEEYGEDAVGSALTTALTMDSKPKNLGALIDSVLRKFKAEAMDPTRKLLALGLKPIKHRGIEYWFPVSEYDGWANQDFDRCADTIASYSSQHPDRVIRVGANG